SKVPACADERGDGTLHCQLQLAVERFPGDARRRQAGRRSSVVGRRSAGPSVEAIVAITCSMSSGGSGGLKKYPWAVVQPRWRRTWFWSEVSTPTATQASPSRSAIEMIEIGRASCRARV